MPTTANEIKIPEEWEEFVDFVLDNASHPLGRAWEVLMRRDLVHETRRALSDLLADLQQATAENKATMPKRQYEAWLRSEGMPNRALLEERIREVRRVTLEIHQENLGRDVNEGRALAARLATAINQHRQACVAAGLEPEAHDRELWARLHDLTATFGAEKLTLNEVIGRGLWYDRPASEATDG